ncbi:hypothetical protein M3N64_08585 [Sporolactobacillus sp. CPB3-1]|uniref:DUF4901 domain-containing protein n=1 Tax=Sporolactobacillus mangiferae TaxID=2940498 RepID=A0ABT0MAW8_9BACL|nr:hypothetical protein [Sporolactobacillus mangiferae]MCL1632004.1 hypothetical protein [Sporolactobacillus mangiferae]
MDERIKALVAFTERKFGLEQYVLKNCAFYRYPHFFNERMYTLSMEWVPRQADLSDDEDLNPDGTAVIEIDVKTRETRSIVFVQDQTFANGVCFDDQDRQTVIKWIEQETGLIYGQQFQLEKVEEERHFYFYECIDGIRIFPSGFLEIQYNANGQLTTFINHTQHPPESQIRREKKTLNPDSLHELAKKQLSMIEIPVYEQEKITAYYAIDEAFVTNAQKKVIPYESLMHEKPVVEQNQVMFWDIPLEGGRFTERDIQLFETITCEQAFSGAPGPDERPITSSEQKQCINVVRDFLRQEYPGDSGKWILKELYREGDYIVATIKLVNVTAHAFQRKLILFIDSNDLKVCKCLDNQLLIDSFSHFQPAEKTTISKEQAYALLAPLLEFQPYYVCDPSTYLFILCRKLDCQYGVNLSDGAVENLNDLVLNR